MASPVPIVRTPLNPYPDSDGKPMADTMLQGEWIRKIFNNLRALFADDAEVFVAADNMVYPVRVEPGETPPCQAPDVYVVFGRPKGYRGSYRYWEENEVPVTVAFEILSPSNTPMEMADKRDFYEEHGIEEYYTYNPEDNQLQIYRRVNTSFRRVRPPHGFVSPRMGVSFDLSGEKLVIRYPDGRPFVEFTQERQRADDAEQLAEQERARAEQERLRADAAEQASQQIQQRLARLLELSRKVRLGQATADEIAELERLESAE
jgi:hypothetical protein